MASAITFTRQQFTTHGYTLHSGTNVPNEALFILGHEMGHIKQGGAYLEGIRKYPRLIGMAGALAGVVLLDMAIARSKKQQKDAAVSDEKLQSTLAEISEEERAKVKTMLRDAADSHKLNSPLGGIEFTLDTIVKAGEYLAAGALGGYGGLHATRKLLIEAEFDADRIGAQLSRDPRAGIRSLQTMEHYIKNMPPNELQELRRKVRPKDAANAYFYHAHPTDAERIARLEAMAQEMEKTGAKMVKNAKVALGSVLERVPSLVSHLSESLHGFRLH